MGCCCCAPVNVLPDDPSILTYAPVTGVNVVKENAFFVQDYAGGFVYIHEDRLAYKTRGCCCRNKGVDTFSIHLKDIEQAEVVQVFRDKGVIWYPPCYSCTGCTGCARGDGILDIRGTVNGVGVHIGVLTPNCQEFLEQVKGHLKSQQ